MTFVYLRSTHVTCYGLDVSFTCIRVTCYGLDVSFTCTHVTCYGLDVACTCTHVTCYASDCAHWHCIDRKLPQVCFHHANASKNLCGNLKTPQRPSLNKKKGWLTASVQSSEVSEPWEIPLFLNTPWFWLTKRMVSSLSNNVQEFLLNKWWFSSSGTSSDKKNHENDAVLARRTSLLTCDKAETMVFTMVLALPQEQDRDVVGKPSQVVTVIWLDLICSSDMFASFCVYVHISRRICSGKSASGTPLSGVIGYALRLGYPCGA